MKVVAADLNQDAQAVADQIRSAGGQALSRGFDIPTRPSYDGLIAMTIKEFEGLDTLLNECDPRFCVRSQKGKPVSETALPPACGASH